MSESRQKVTVSLQPRKETNGISPKSDSFFTSVYRKYRNNLRRMFHKTAIVATKPGNSPENVPESLQLCFCERRVLIA